MNKPTRRDTIQFLASGGFVALASGSLLGRETPLDDNKIEDRWRAWAITEGDQTKLVVEGIYNLGGPGLIVTLNEAVPQGTNPKILLLEIKTATLPGLWPAVLQPVPAHFSKTPYKKGQYQSVQIRYPNRTVVTIDSIIDAGKGPK